MPRPSSPVYAKASTNCPYLTLESPHHQRQRWAKPSRGMTNSAEQRRAANLVRMIIISARLFSDDIAKALRTAFRQSAATPKCACEPLARSSSSQTHTATASILRTHSQCQRGSYSTQHHRALARRTVSLHPWKIRLAGVARRCAVSRSEAGRCGALRSAGRACRSARKLRLLVSTSARWWSLSGSNR